MIDVQALAGDPSDNVPGVPGVGVKTAAELINTYGDLDTLLDRAEEIKQPKRRQNLIEHAGMARISRDLVTLRRDVPVEEDVEALEIRPPDPDKLFVFLDEMGFATLSARLRARLGKDAGKVATPPSAEAGGDGEYVAVQSEEVLSVWIAAAEAAGMWAFPYRWSQVRLVTCRSATAERWGKLIWDWAMRQLLWRCRHKFRSIVP